MRSDQVCRLLDEFAYRTGRRAEREVDASVYASVTEMPVGKRVELVAGEQGLELAQVPRQPVWRDRRVLPSATQQHRPVSGYPVRRRPPGFATARRLPD